MAESNDAREAPESHDEREGQAGGEAGTESDTEAGPRPKKPRGFAAMDPEKQRAISRKGGESVPVEKRSFSQDRELAAQAGRKGGAARGGRGAGPHGGGAGDEEEDR